MTYMGKQAIRTRASRNPSLLFLVPFVSSVSRLDLLSIPSSRIGFQRLSGSSTPLPGLFSSTRQLPPSLDRTARRLGSTYRTERLQSLKVRRTASCKLGQALER